MNNENPFEKLSLWLGHHSMTDAEKRSMRATIAHYATTHPVKSGLMSPYGFRAAFAIIATLVLVLGGSVGVTQAAANSLPNSKLYPIKLWIEEFQASEQKTPQAVIAYETSRINTRFSEATELAVRHELNDQTSSVIENGLAHSQDIIKSSANQIASTNPELALAAANSIETAYSSNGKVLSAIGRNTNQNLDTFILGAQISTESLALEKTQFEQIVATKPNSDTQSSAQLALAAAQTALAKLPADAVASPAMPMMMAAKMVAPAATAPITAAPVAAPAPVQTPADQASDLINQAKAKMAAGSYSEALVILQKAQQIIDETNLTQSLEKTYQVITDPASASTSDTTPPEQPLPNPLLQGEGAEQTQTPATPALQINAQ